MAEAHPPQPPLVMRARLAELDGCWLEVHCACFSGSTMIPVRLLAARRGGRGGHDPLGAILTRLVCKRCQGKPAAVHLNESHRRQSYGGSAAGWSVQLVP